MAGIYHPSRGGVRGGIDQFSWEDVKTDKDRENYLGHSVMVPVGKWQEGKDLIWYTRDKQKKDEVEAKRKQEIKSVKDLESRAMAAALGHGSFSKETTSLTAKELQEVLSRGQTEHSEADVVKGMGFKKSLGSKKQKYGTEFVGGSQTKETSDDNKSEIDEGKRRSSKKKKKKKKKKKCQSEEEHSDEGDWVPVVSSNTSSSSKHSKRRHKDNEKYNEKRPISRAIDDDSWGRENNHRSESYMRRIEGGSQHSRRNDGNDYKRSYKHDNTEKTYEQSRIRSEDNSKDESRKRYTHNSRSPDNSKRDSTKKRYEQSRHRSEDKSREEINKTYMNSRSPHDSDRKSHSFSQPGDSNIKFHSKKKRLRGESSNDSDG